MGFQQGLSGLSAAGKQLDVIGNNVANASTVGFKGSRAEFADLYANSLSAVSSTQVGIGVQTVNVSQSFSQGNITSTQNPLDLAISGSGFFQVNAEQTGDGLVAYSRNGQFKLNKDGYFVNDGYFLTGYKLDDQGNEVGAEQPLNIANIGEGIAKPTTNVTWSLNLDADDTRTAQIPSTTPPATPAIPVVGNSATYSYTNTTKFYDNYGVSHDLTVYMVKRDAVNNVWDVYRTIDGGAIENADGTAASDPSAFQMKFKSDGTLDKVTAGYQYQFNIVNGALAGTPPTALELDPTAGIKVSFDKTTQYSGEFSVTRLSYDGYPLGRLAGVSVSSSGLISAKFSNGYVQNVGRVKLYNFVNPQGLTPVGGNRWLYSDTAGAKSVASPDSAGMGSLRSGATEDSNVDTTAELVNMIIAQRFYQANAQTIKTQDAVLQTLLNLR